MLPYNNHVRERCLSFTCGDTDLDDFFHNDADRYSAELMGKTYCWITEQKPHRIVALFTLANDSIKTMHLDKSTRNRLNRPIDNPKRGRSYCRFALAQAAKAFHFFCPNKRNETKKIRRLHFLGYSGKCFR